MNIVCMSEACDLIDVAFQVGTFAEQARDAHRFAAMLFEKGGNDFLANARVDVSDNESYYYVRVTKRRLASFYRMRKTVFAAMIAIDPACDTDVRGVQVSR